MALVLVTKSKKGMDHVLSPWHYRLSHVKSICGSLRLKAGAGLDYEPPVFSWIDPQKLECIGCKRNLSQWDPETLRKSQARAVKRALGIEVPEGPV